MHYRLSQSMQAHPGTSSPADVSVVLNTVFGSVSSSVYSVLCRVVVCLISGYHALLTKQKATRCSYPLSPVQTPTCLCHRPDSQLRKGGEGKCTHSVCGLVISLCKLCIGMASRAFRGHLHAGSAAVVTTPALEKQKVRAPVRSHWCGWPRVCQYPHMWVQLHRHRWGCAHFIPCRPWLQVPAST